MAGKKRAADASNSETDTNPTKQRKVTETQAQATASTTAGSSDAGVRSKLLDARAADDDASQTAGAIPAGYTLMSEKMFISEAAKDVLTDLLEQAEHRDPDAFDMYIYNGACLFACFSHEADGSRPLCIWRNASGGPRRAAAQTSLATRSSISSTARSPRSTSWQRRSNGPTR
jgi:hypothetical protein